MKKTMLLLQGHTEPLAHRANISFISQPANSWNIWVLCLKETKMDKNHRTEFRLKQIIKTRNKTVSWDRPAATLCVCVCGVRVAVSDRKCARSPERCHSCFHTCDEAALTSSSVGLAKETNTTRLSAATIKQPHARTNPMVRWRCWSSTLNFHLYREEHI